MKRNRKAKILATLGPASSSQETIEKLFVAGCDVFRMNFSHGSIEDHRKNYDLIRSLEKKFHHTTCILADLQGPKLRVSNFKNNQVELKKGQEYGINQGLTNEQLVKEGFKADLLIWETDKLETVPYSFDNRNNIFKREFKST